MDAQGRTVGFMSDRHDPPVRRHCDVCVVGGSAAGLAAALQLSRQRRSVIVIDSGEPRNAPAAHMHSFLGRDGTSPSELTDAGREEVRGYGGEVLTGRATDVRRLDDGRFEVELESGHSVIARRVLAATGLVDELPDVEGIAEQWGRGVIHCPFCHGYEVRDQRVVLLATHARGLHPAALFRQLTQRLTVVVHDDAGVDDADVTVLRASGVGVVEGSARRVVEDAVGRVAGLELVDGTVITADVIAIGPRFAVRADPFASLGLRPVAHPTGGGDHIETDAMGETAVNGVYAAGNIADPSNQVLQAAAEGSRIGAMISFSLAEQDMRAAARPSANVLDWDDRYGDEPLWSGNPNGSLVNEISGLRRGTALDIGAGEGGDAIWLAEQGWTVTASDVSQRALNRVAVGAERRGVNVERLFADANDGQPFGGRTFDLVSAQYASIPRTPDGRGVQNLVAAVAPGGTLLVVCHDLEPMRTPVDPGHGRPFDPDAYVRVEDVAEALRCSPDWTIDVYEKRERPPGAATAAHHVEDVVLRATRR
jgi:thioredoxin reductase/SAM-dependent methyltransferase